MVSLTSIAQSLFYRLRLEDQLAQAASGDSKLKEELRRCKAGWKTSEEENKKLAEANKKLKSKVIAVSRERDTFSKTVSELDKEKGQLEIERSARVRELTQKIESYQEALTGYKGALDERYNTGYVKGIQDYMLATWERVPHVD